MKLTINTNFPDIAKALTELHKDVATQATARALNRMMEQARTAMSREIRAEFALPAAKVNQALRINRASAKGGLFRIEASLESPRQQGRSLNLINFVSGRQNKGVTVKIKRNGSRKVITGAFIANGGRTVFERVPGTVMASRSKYGSNKHSQQIKAVQTIDVAQMFNTRRINAKVVQLLQDKFPEIFAREAKFYTDRFNARRASK